MLITRTPLNPDSAEDALIEMLLPCRDVTAVRRHGRAVEYGTAGWSSFRVRLLAGIASLRCCLLPGRRKSAANNLYAQMFQLTGPPAAGW